MNHIKYYKEFGNKIGFININNPTLVNRLFKSKYRMLIDHESIGKHFRFFLDNNLFLYKDNIDWINNIYYYTLKSDIHIYFKKYYVLTVNENNISDSIYEKIVDAIINVVIQNSIKLPLKFISNFLKIEIDKDLHRLIYDKYSNLEIYFHIQENIIYLSIKNNIFSNFSIEKTENELKNENYIVNKYYNILKSKKKIAILLDNNDFDSDDKIIELTEYLFKNGFWLDIICKNNPYIGKMDIYTAIINYDAIIFQGSTIYKILEVIDINNTNNMQLFENKIYINIPINFSWDICRYLKGFTKTLTTNYPKILYIGRRNIDHIESYISGYAWRVGIDKLDTFERLKKIGTSFNCPIFKQCITNDTILEKKDFFRIYGLDLNKKLVTIFINWPKKKQSMYTNKGRDSLEFDILKKNFLNNFIKTFEKNNCQIVFKGHPRTNVYYIEDKIILEDYVRKDTDDYQFTDFQQKCNLDVYDTKKCSGIVNLIEQYIFVDSTFQTELYKYTDYGVIFSLTSVGWFNYIYDFPILSISTKNNSTEYWSDWFQFLYIEPESDYSKECLNKYKNSFESKIDNNKLFNMADVYYGVKTYWEDCLINMDKIINDFVTIDHKINYKYFNDNPLYGNTYYSSQKDIGDIIIKLLNNDKIFSNNISYFIDKKFMIVYENKNINVNIYNNSEVEIIINNKPADNYGVHFLTRKMNEPICKLILSFECKLKNHELSIYPKIFTGITWITLNNELDIKYKKYTLTEEFNLQTISKWRLSSTTKKISQSIYFKNISITNL